MAAVRLARAGASVALFDPSHPREKPCGGGLTGRALALVADVIDIDSLPRSSSTSATVEASASARAANVATRSIAARTPDSSLARRQPRRLRSRAASTPRLQRARDLIPEKVDRRRPAAGRAWSSAPSAASTSPTTCSAPTARTAWCARSSRRRSRARNSRWRRDSSSTASTLEHRHQDRCPNSPDICGRFLGPIISRSASARRLTHHITSRPLRAQSRRGSSNTASIGRQR